MQAAKEAGKSVEMMKLSNNLGAVQRKKLGKIEDAYEVHQVPMTHLSHDFLIQHERLRLCQQLLHGLCLLRHYNKAVEQLEAERFWKCLLWYG